MRACGRYSRTPATIASTGAAAQLPARAELLEGGDQGVDLVVRVHRRELDAKAGLILRHERVGGERHVHATVEEHAADGVDPPVVVEGHLDDREAGPVRG